MRLILQNKCIFEVNTDSHSPEAHLLQSLSLPSLFVLLWDLNEGKQCRPAKPERYRRGVRERDAWKEKGWALFRPCGFFLQTVCGKTLRGRQTHQSFTHPSPPDIILHQEHRGKWWVGGEAWTEKLFRVRMDKDGGGVEKEMRVHLPLLQQYTQESNYTKLNGSNTYNHVRATTSVILHIISKIFSCQLAHTVRGV